MIGRALRISAVLIVGLGLASACGSSDRPSELSLSDVKPCDLLSRSNLNQLQVSVDPQSLDFVSGVDTEGVSCVYRLPAGNSVQVSTITNHGIDRWMNGQFEHAKFQEVSRIQGFRTIRVWHGGERPNPNQTCSVYVDVAGGESLRVEVGKSFEEEDAPTCDTARRFAEAAMKTLASGRG